MERSVIATPTRTGLPSCGDTTMYKVLILLSAVSDWCPYYTIRLVPILYYQTGAHTILSDWCPYYTIRLVPILYYQTGAHTILSDWCPYYTIRLVPILYYQTGAHTILSDWCPYYTIRLVPTIRLMFYCIITIRLVPYYCATRLVPVPVVQ